MIGSLLFDTRFICILFLGLACTLTACQKEDDDDMMNPDPDPQPECDASLRPVVFIHGFLGSGDTYAGQFQRFHTNGYCLDRLFAFDWNSLGDDMAAVQELDSFIEEVLNTTGASQVDLAGHSAGGTLSYLYMNDAQRAGKVAHYAHLGSGAHPQPPGPDGAVATINVWSTADVVVDSDDIPGATNVMLEGLDHYQVATAPETFRALFRFFNDGGAAETTDIEPEEKPQIAGKILTFGENTPRSGAIVEIYELDPGTGRRLGPAPSATLLTGSDGTWGPWQAKPGVPYEFFVPAAGQEDRPLHYFREPVTHSNPLIYLRTLPPPSSQAGLLLAGLPEDNGQSVLAIFSSSQAVIYPRDELIVRDLELSSERYAAEAANNIAFFLYDDGDQQSSGEPHTVFSFLPLFVNGVDYFIPTTPTESIELTFNGRTLYVPNLPSGTEGVLIVVFD